MRGLLARGVPETARPFGGLVYRQALEHLHGVRDEASTRALIAQENRRYARRQLIWFRKEPNLIWLDGPGESPSTIAAAAHLIEQRQSANLRTQDAERREYGTKAAGSSESTTEHTETRAVPFFSVISCFGGSTLSSLRVLSLEFYVYTSHRHRHGQRRHRRAARRVGLWRRGQRHDRQHRATGAAADPDAAPARAGACRQDRRSAASRVARRGGRPHGGSLRREGLGHRPLGDDGHRARPAVSGIPRRISGGRSSTSFRDGPDAASSATRRHPARRSSTSSVRSTCAPARSSSTPPPTACFRLPRTKRWCPVPELYRACEIAYRLVGEGLGVGRVIARPFVGVAGALHTNGEPPRLRAAAVRRNAARPRESREAARRRHRQDRGLVRRPRDDARHPHGERRRRDGPGREADVRARSRAAVREPGRFRYAVRSSQRRRRLRAESRAVRCDGWRRCCRRFARTIS